MFITEGTVTVCAPWSLRGCQRTHLCTTQRMSLVLHLSQQWKHRRQEKKDSFEKRLFCYKNTATLVYHREAGWVFSLQETAGRIQIQYCAKTEPSTLTAPPPPTSSPITPPPLAPTFFFYSALFPNKLLWCLESIRSNIPLLKTSWLILGVGGGARRRGAAGEEGLKFPFLLKADREGFDGGQQGFLLSVQSDSKEEECQRSRGGGQRGEGAVHY